jgi:hypothetical protein
MMGFLLNSGGACSLLYFRASAIHSLPALHLLATEAQLFANPFMYIYFLPRPF